MATDSITYHSAELVRELNRRERGSTRYETIRGELIVTPGPAPWHQTIVTRLITALSHYLEREPVGVCYASPSDISWGRDDVLVQPDALVVPIAHARRAVASRRWDAVRQLLLAVEVLSPSSARTDRFTKRTLFQEMGVPLYWIVDGERREVEMWTPALHFPQVERERLTWLPAGAEVPFTLELATLFAPL